MVGDEQEPDDIEWDKPFVYDYAPGKPEVGRFMKEIPEWLQKGLPRPSQNRHTVVSFKFSKKLTIVTIRDPWPSKYYHPSWGFDLVMVTNYWYRKKCCYLLFKRASSSKIINKDSYVSPHFWSSQGKRERQVKRCLLAPQIFKNVPV